MAKILSPLVMVCIDSKYYEQHEPFRVQSEVLRKKGYKDIVEVPKGFVHDKESVPLVRGTSDPAGVIHDYLSRCNSIPIVTKRIAAAVYFEILEADAARVLAENGGSDSFIDKMKTTASRLDYWWRRWVKWAVVWSWPGYFHVNPVEATYTDLSGKTHCPSLTV